METGILRRANLQICNCFYWLNILHIMTGETFEVPCEAGWTLSPVSGSCLKPSLVKRTWEDARLSCQVEDADLVKILDSKMNDFILNLNSRFFPIFIGMKSRYNVCYWRDENSWAVYNYTRFVKGDRSYKPDDNCVIMLGEGSNKGKWDFASCLSEHRYYCEKGPALCPAEWLPSDASGTCIKFFLLRYNFWQAREFCQQHGGDLVTIRSPEMAAFIEDQRYFSKITFHTGLNNLRNKNEYRWLNYPEKLNYTNWDPKQPGACKQICSVVVSDESRISTPGPGGRWYRVQFNFQSPFFCEKYADCKNEKYGMICPAKCSWHCVNRTCHVKSGRCYYGCEPGFGGSRCNIRTEFKYDLDIFDALRFGILYLVCIFSGVYLLGICLEKRRRATEADKWEGEGQGDITFDDAHRISFTSEATEINQKEDVSLHFEPLEYADQQDGAISLSAFQRIQAWLNKIETTYTSKESLKSDNAESKSVKSLHSNRSQKMETCI